jgi:hypothetical protein
MQVALFITLYWLLGTSIRKIRKQGADLLHALHQTLWEIPFSLLFSPLLKQKCLSSYVFAKKGMVTWCGARPYGESHTLRLLPADFLR